jgi:hypothetical protein
MENSKRISRGAWAFVAFLVIGSELSACSDDNGPTGDGTGGTGSGGKATGGSSGGKATGGSGGGTAGSGGKATGGSGGGTAGSGGSGGTGGKGTGGKQSIDGGQDGDAGCVSPQALYYDKPGCNGTVAPVCAGPTFDACLSIVCGCDGEMLSGCGFYEKPWSHPGACSDAGDGGGGGDSGNHNDAGDGG